MAAQNGLLISEPQQVLQVQALEGEAQGGGWALEQLPKQVAEEPDWGHTTWAKVLSWAPVVVPRCSCSCEARQSLNNF